MMKRNPSPWAHHEHRAGAGQLEPFDLESEPEQPADPSEVTDQPRALDAVDTVAPHRSIAPEREQPDPEQAAERPQLAEEEPPQHHEQADGHPGLAPS